MAHVSRMRAGDHAHRERRRERRAGSLSKNDDDDAVDYAGMTDEEFDKANRKAVRKAMKKSLEIVLYVIFLLIFTISTLYTRDPKFGFYMNDFMKDLFINEEFPDINTLKTFNDVATVEEMWDYIEGPFVEGLAYGDGFIYGVNRLMGYARMRQLRVREDSCEVLDEFKSRVPFCIGDFSNDVEFTEPFGLQTDAWMWVSQDDLDVSTVIGRISRYGGGGYVQYLKGNATTDAEALAELKDNNWVDIQTKVVMLEFNSYNANINMWHMARLMFELLPSGGIVPSHYFAVMRLNNYYQESSDGRTQLALDILVYIFVLAYILQETKELVKHGVRDYLTEGWNYLDLTNLSIFLIALGIRVAIIYTYDDLGIKSDNDEQYYDLGQISYLIQLQFNMNALNAFLLWFKIFKFLTFSKSSMIIGKTIQKGLAELVVFVVMIFFLIIGFAQAGVLAFGTDIWGHKDFLVSMYTLLRALLGDFDFESLYYANRFMGPVFFASFTVLFIFILLNVFLAIINESYETIQEEYQSKEAKENYFITVWQHTEKKHPNSRIIKFVKNRINEIESFQSDLRSESADANKDGVIDRDEFSKIGGNMTMFNEADIDGDGVLDDDEVDKLHAKLEREKAELEEEVGAFEKAEREVKRASIEMGDMGGMGGMRNDQVVFVPKDSPPDMFIDHHLRNKMSDMEVGMAAIQQKLDLLLGSGVRPAPAPPAVAAAAPAAVPAAAV